MARDRFENEYEEFTTEAFFEERFDPYENETPLETAIREDREFEARQIAAEDQDGGDEY